MSAENAEPPPQRLGMVATDPLRIAGMQEMLAPAFEVVPMDVLEVLRQSETKTVIVDEPGRDQLLPLIAALRRARPELKVIVLSGDSDPEWTRKVIGTGAKGFLSHSATKSEIEMCIGVVEDGSVWAPRKVLAKLIEQGLAEPLPKPEPEFTQRERQVLELLAGGAPNREIAGELGIDEATVKAHISRLLRKVGVPNRVALIMKVLDRKLVLPKKL